MKWMVLVPYDILFLIPCAKHLILLARAVFHCFTSLPLSRVGSLRILPVTGFTTATANSASSVVVVV